MNVSTIRYRRFVASCSMMLAIVATQATAQTILTFGDAGHSVSDSADWASNGFTGLGLNEFYQSAGNNNATSTWDFTGLANGTYYVAANWTTEPNRTDVARYTLSDGGTDAVINQQSGVRDFYDMSAGIPMGWTNLGQVTVADGDLSVTLSDDGDALTSNLFMMADSIRISQTPGTSTLPGIGLGTVIDVGDPGHTFLGEGPTNGTGGGVAEWIYSNPGYNAVGSGFNHDYWFDNEDGFVNHSGALGSEWTLTGLTPGSPVIVSATWIEFSNRGQDVPFTVSGAVGGDQTVLVDQQLAPIAHAYEADESGIVHPFQRIGVFTPTGTTLTVTMTNGANGFVIPDAVRFQQVPEPSTAVALLLGFGCLAATYKRMVPPTDRI